MNNIIYCDDPLYVSEALNLCTLFANNESIHMDAPKYVRESVDASVYIDELMSLNKKCYLKSLALFNQYEPSKLSIASTLFGFLSAHQLQEENAPAQLLHVIEKNVNGNVADISFATVLEIVPGDNYRFIDKFLTLNLSNDFKVDFLKVAFNPKDSLDLIWHDINLLTPYLHDIFQRYNTNQYKTYYTREKVSALVEPVYKSQCETCYIVPSLTYPTRLSLTVSDDTTISHSPTTALVGVLLDSTLLDNQDFLNDDLQQHFSYFLKAINDPSKLKIIELLKHQQMYGAQLAQALNLSTPTVSYHMDTLLNSGIVNASKVNNRMNYSFNKEKCSELLTLLHHKLLD